MRTTNRQFSFVGDIILMCKIALKSLVRFDNKLETLYFESRTSQAGLLIIISQSEKNIEMKIQQRDLSNFLNKKTSQLLYLVWVFCSKLVQKRGKFRITKNMKHNDGEKTKRQKWNLFPWMKKIQWIEINFKLRSKTRKLPFLCL